MLPYSPWLSWIIPLIGCVFIPLFFKLSKRIGEVYSVALIFLASAFSLSMIPDVWGGKSWVEKIPWIPIPRGFIEAGVIVDPLSVLMACIATFIGAWIMLYSIGYMAHEEGLPRYYFFMVFFIGGMTGLVMANNFLQLYIFWEIVGLCSYALIGFYYRKPEAAHAGIKAFVTTRVGDVLMLIGIMILYSLFGTFDYSQLNHALSHSLKEGTVSLPLLITVLVLLFGGAVGKSAQIPLHVWLPDAMEGPTPVSALIHAATMVKAGIYLTARLTLTIIPFEEFPPTILHQWYMTVAYIGAVTAFFAATMGLVMTDIKRIVAYSTISQLGLMLASLGLASELGWTASTFHLLNHSLFKALLFLSAGSVMHAVGTTNIDEMGGLAKSMPITFSTSLIGALALAGVPPFSGFFSKDLIIEASLEVGSTPIYLLITFTSILTFIYIGRWIYKIFLAQPKHSVNHHVHESPPVMTIPLIVLAVGATISGIYLETTHGFTDYLGIKMEHGVGYLTLLTSSAIILFGASMTYLVYFSGKIPPERFRINALGYQLHKLLLNRYYVDALYYKFVDWFIDSSRIVRRTVEDGGIDRFNYLVADGVKGAVNVLRNIQTGSSNINVGGILLGLAILILIFLALLYGGLW
ncbi:MAG: NADH-quinone oxidoreductase subunit L [Aigarchaeota archaeon]|nr:NADH-quinone oxidoreductase subunit L [Aigarchaeota archaeon]MCX8192322.1 NADH-quinone oxidoreductase subunit L [Nitrososphaeria archaeon]MDW7986846.1 NADH-quinone oxidoreductase subunit L [Nitrososphaerota archaeon]